MQGLAMVGLALTAAILAVYLRPQRPEISLVLSMAAGAMLLFAAVGWMGQLLDQVQALQTQLPLGQEQSKIIFKALGICVVAQLACDACKDAGESAVASKLELASRMLVLTMSLPLLQEVLAIISSLFEL